MADVKARELPTSQAFDPTTDYLLAIKGDASGARSGPYKVPAQNVSVGSATSGGGGSGGGGGTVVGGIAKVFGREGPEISAAANDYTAAQVDFDPTTSGLAADNVQTAIDAVAALRETSIIFALVLSRLAFGEKVGGRRIAAALLVMAGVAALRLF